MNLQLLFAYDMIIHLGNTEEQKVETKKAFMKWAVTNTQKSKEKIPFTQVKNN